MKAFMDEEYLLESETASRLYHTYAETLPIIDYHCHVDPQEIAENRQYDTITQVWLGADHYKWRAMRWAGIPERDITGAKDADPYRCFAAFAATLPRAVGNPLYGWAHLELKRYFGITEPLTPASAPRIYAVCNQKLAEPGMRVRGILARSRVQCLCTTDDPADDLRWHRQIASDADFAVKVLPTFRPDKALQIEKPAFAAYLQKLGGAAGIAIDSFASLCAALDSRLSAFTALGCRVTDHGLDHCFFRPVSPEAAERALQKALSGERPTAAEADGYKTALLLHLAGRYAEKKLVMQIHFGCLRNCSAKMEAALGPDTGYDAVSNGYGADALAGLLNAMESANGLPRVILYSLDQYDNETIASIAGAFQTNADCPGRVQLGSAWWFNDHRAGMEKQLTDLANLGVLGSFVGMLTDSRSYLSYTRHELFRRVLCNWLGRQVENGEYPADEAALGALVQDLCYRNAVRYFRLQD